MHLLTLSSIIMDVDKFPQGIIKNIIYQTNNLLENFLWNSYP